MAFKLPIIVFPIKVTFSLTVYLEYFSNNVQILQIYDDYISIMNYMPFSPGNPQEIKVLPDRIGRIVKVDEQIRVIDSFGNDTLFGFYAIANYHTKKNDSERNLSLFKQLIKFKEGSIASSPDLKEVPNALKKLKPFIFRRGEADYKQELFPELYDKNEISTGDIPDDEQRKLSDARSGFFRGVTRLFLGEYLKGKNTLERSRARFYCVSPEAKNGDDYLIIFIVNLLFTPNRDLNTLLKAEALFEEEVRRAATTSMQKDVIEICRSLFEKGFCAGLEDAVSGLKIDSKRKFYYERVGDALVRLAGINLIAGNAVKAFDVSKKALKIYQICFDKIRDHLVELKEEIIEETAKVLEAGGDPRRMAVKKNDTEKAIIGNVPVFQEQALIFRKMADYSLHGQSSISEELVEMLKRFKRENLGFPLGKKQLSPIDEITWAIIVSRFFERFFPDYADMGYDFRLRNALLCDWE